jgi:hypothetical protein
VTESSKPVSQSNDVKFLREENGRAIYEIASGEYKFESKN